MVATDSLGNRGTMAVTVKVPNMDEDGVVTLSRTQPRVGVPVTASLTDPDGNISGVKWQWYTGAINDDNIIEDATSDTYTPTEADATATVILMVRASYTDGQGAIQKMADGVATNLRSRWTPGTSRRRLQTRTETDGTQNETATRKVQENTKALAADDAADATDADDDNVGNALTATDPDPNMDRG